MDEIDGSLGEGYNITGDGGRGVGMLAHSYALTIHRAQGSEWNFIILYIPYSENFSTIVNKNLIYTAITRARRAIFCVGDRSHFERVSIRPLSFRCEKLKERICEQLPIIETMVEEKQIEYTQKPVLLGYEDDDIPLDDDFPD